VDFVLRVRPDEAQENADLVCIQRNPGRHMYAFGQIDRNTPIFKNYRQSCLGAAVRVPLNARISPGSHEAYAVAAICVAIATVVRWSLGMLWPDVMPFPTFYPAVLFSVLLGGIGPGLFAAALGGVMGWWAFMPPPFAFQPSTPHQKIDLLLYLFAAFLIVWGADHYRRLAKRLADEETLRKLSVEELSHRLKNKLATIQSIVSFRLREYPQVSKEIITSLDALSATDELIMGTQGQGARVGDILSAEVRPYEASRVAMDGPEVLLPPK
jgi:K+-sensing histidine kinase KdpD